MMNQQERPIKNDQHPYVDRAELFEGFNELYADSEEVAEEFYDSVASENTREFPRNYSEDISELGPGIEISPYGAE